MIQLDRPLVIGHRGFPTVAIENTLPSFAAAFEAGAQGVECDVRTTRDGQVVVFHDEDTRRLLGFSGRIEDAPSDTVRTYTFVGAPAGVRVPTLEDVLVLAEERGALVLVELKGAPIVDRDFARAVVACVERTRTADRVAFLSFSHAAIAGLRELAPAIPAGPLFDRAPSEEAAAFALRGAGAGAFLGLPASLATPSVVAPLRARGLSVVCWGVDDEAIDERLDAAGVGLRISDQPHRLLARRLGATA